MSSFVSETEFNVLESYLNDVFEYECEFKALSDEIVFIQTSIEKFVQRIVDVTTEWIARQYAERPRGENESTKENQEQEEQQVHLESVNHNIIKVGSFYERTRNTFPDEFDFIFYLCQTQLLDVNSTKHVTHLIYEVADRLKESLTICSQCSALNGTMCLYFDKCLGIHGPATNLQFIYKSGHGKSRVIHVDIVPAVKVTERNDDNVDAKNDLNWYFRFIEKNMNPESFRQQVLSCRYYLKVNRRLSFTETEVYFMRNVLLRKHLKLYRILKFLLNGHVEMLQSFLSEVQLESSLKGFCSYQIKVMMIYHHDECTNKETDEIGSCALYILREICKYTSSGKRLTFFGLENAVESPLLPHLKLLIESLKKMKTFSVKYDYKSTKLDTLPMQYLNALDKHDPKYDVWFRYLDHLLEEEKPSYKSWRDFLTLFTPVPLRYIFSP